MAGYALVATEPTVQVISPTIVNDVVYCTIQTQPSGVVAGITVQKSVFDANAAGAQLTIFADAIEQVMGMDHVIAGVGEQSIDDNGLIQDNVAFTVQYVPNTTSPTQITAEALVPVGYLNFTDALIGQASLTNVENIISGVYANLQAAAAG